MSIHNVGNVLYHKIPIIEIKQKSVIYYVGALTGDVLYKTYTVEPLIYTSDNYKYDDFNFSDISSDKLLTKIAKDKESKFQRNRDEDKVKSIKQYLNTEKYALLPNSIIVAAKFKNDFMDEDMQKDPIGVTDSEWIENFNKIPGLYYHDNHLYIPETVNALLVIDGQHRLYGFEDWTAEQKKRYQLVVSFLVGMDNSVLAQLFYTINYTQKSVNKSLLYHLTSEFTEDLTEIKLLHEFIRMLNENSKSPFYNNIKMLGKGAGYVSQAFLIDMLLPYFLMVKKRSRIIPIFRHYYISDKRQIVIINTLIKYFIAIKNIFNEQSGTWDARSTVLTKTIGIGAFIKILPRVLLAVMEEVGIQNSPDKLGQIKVDQFQKFLQPIYQLNLNKYAKAGSLGLIGQLQEELESLLRLQYINSQYIFDKLSWLSKYYYKTKNE